MHSIVCLHQLKAGFFCDGTRRYGVPGNENDESIVCTYVSIVLV